MYFRNIYCKLANHNKAQDSWADYMYKTINECLTEKPSVDFSTRHRSAERTEYQFQFHLNWDVIYILRVLLHVHLSHLLLWCVRYCKVLYNGFFSQWRRVINSKCLCFMNTSDTFWFSLPNITLSATKPLTNYHYHLLSLVSHTWFAFSLQQLNNIPEILIPVYTATLLPYRLLNLYFLIVRVLTIFC